METINNITVKLKKEFFGVVTPAGTFESVSKEKLEEIKEQFSDYEITIS